MTSRLKIKTAEIVQLLGGQEYEFPKYTTQLINLANQNSGGTRPKVVGQMSELIQEFDGMSLTEWIDWYNDKNPNALESATGKILAMVEKLRHAIELIDGPLVREWVMDLIHNKTFAGLLFQEAILKRISEAKGLTYRLADSAEEAQGIDGYIGKTPVSIKSSTYDSKPMLPETIPVTIITYEKKKDGIVVNYGL